MSISPADLPPTGIEKVDNVLRKASAKLREIINALNNTSATETKILRDVTITSGGKAVPHGLGRTPQGYRVIYSDFNGGAGLSPVCDYKRPDIKNLYLITSNSHSVALEVF